MQDPVAFLEEAARAVNEADVDAAVSAYSADVRVMTITDGAVEEYRGADAARRMWGAYLSALGPSGFRLSKRMVSSTGEVIVNVWSGSLHGRTRAEGMESWRFNERGQVCEHVLYSFLDARPSTSLRQRGRLALQYPMTALRLIRAQRRWSASPGGQVVPARRRAR